MFFSQNFECLKNVHSDRDERSWRISDDGAKFVEGEDAGQVQYGGEPDEERHLQRLSHSGRQLKFRNL